MAIWKGNNLDPFWGFTDYMVIKHLVTGMIPQVLVRGFRDIPPQTTVIIVGLKKCPECNDFWNDSIQIFRVKYDMIKSYLYQMDVTFSALKGAPLMGPFTRSRLEEPGR